MQLNKILQGRAKFPTGGIVRDSNSNFAARLNRFKSGTDSKVWMEEESTYRHSEAIALFW